MARTATTKQVAAALGVKATTVQLYSRENRIPFDRTPGGHRRYDIDEVLGFLALEREPSMLAPLPGQGPLGAGVTFARSAMATMDTSRRAIVGEHLEDRCSSTESAALTLIGSSPKVLLAN